MQGQYRGYIIPSKREFGGWIWCMCDRFDMRDVLEPDGGVVFRSESIFIVRVEGRCWGFRCGNVLRSLLV